MIHVIAQPKTIKIKVGQKTEKVVRLNLDKMLGASKSLAKAISFAARQNCDTIIS